ncbi:MAG: site-specific integrase [Planctomycetota bacterium]|jgi:site-specific recombinase XerD
MTTLSSFPGLLEAFFTDRLMRQRQASPHTIASYRDTFRLLLEFASPRLRKIPSALSLDDLDAPLIGTFLDHLETARGISARSRNVRLAAIHSFFKYAAFQQPAHSALIQRVLAMPSKRYDKSAIEFLSRSEIDALIASPDQRAWIGRRDRALLLLAVQSGLRVSELVGLRCQDVVLDSGAHVRCQGKGRKERCTPLRKEAVTVLRAWLREQNSPPASPLFPNMRGGQLSRDAVADLLAKHVHSASLRCPSLKQKRVSPHVLRHTAAMDLLQHGVDRSVIALWLGHESIETTQMYLHANLQLKEAALARTAPMNVRAGRYRPGDRLLAFLKSL